MIIKEKSKISRLISALAAMMLSLSFINDAGFLQTFAEEIIEESVFEDYSASDETEIMDEGIQETVEEQPVIDLTNVDIPTASFVEEEVQPDEEFSYEHTFRRAVRVLAATPSSFTPDNYQAKADDKGLEIFWMKYVTILPDAEKTEVSATNADGSSSVLESISVDDNFSIKTKLKIKSNLPVNVGQMEIKVKRTLFENRDSGSCVINSVGVSEFSEIPTKEANGAYVINDETGGADDNVPFRYYLNDNDEYVFVNTRALNSNTTEIEISYNTVEVFDVRTAANWKIVPEIDVKYEMERTGILSADPDSTMVYTECTLNGSTTVYRHEIEANGSNNYYTYYDIDGNPLYVHNRTLNKWYKVRDDYTGHILPAADLAEGHADEITDPAEIPAITSKTEIVTDSQHYGDCGIRGDINTDASITKVEKTPLPESGRGYAPQLYSQGHIKKYIHYEYAKSVAPDAFKDDGSLNTDDYVFVGWQVEVAGDCSQPFSMLFDENPFYIDGNGQRVYLTGTDAEVLGITTCNYSNGTKHTDIRLNTVKYAKNQEDIDQLYEYLNDSQKADLENDYWYVADTNREMRGDFGYDNVVKNKKYSNYYYVVVAYKKDTIKRDTPITDDSTGVTYRFYDVGNDVTAKLYKRDGLETASSSDAATPVALKEFKWEDGNYGYYSNKSREGEDKDGWLTAFNYSSDKNQALGSFVFKASFTGYYYSTTHENSGSYDHIDGKYVKLVAADDVMTAQPYGDIIEDGSLKRLYGAPQMLDGTDYEYYKIDLSLSEQDTDVFNDEELDVDTTTQIYSVDSDLNRDWVVYGMYAGSDAWVPIDLNALGYSFANGSTGRISVEEYAANAVASSGSTRKVYTINLNFADKSQPCPFRIKIEHNDIAYRSATTMKLYTRFLPRSTRLGKTGTLRNGTFYDSNCAEYTVDSSSGEAIATPSGGTAAHFQSFFINLNNYSGNTATEVDAVNKWAKPLICDYYQNKDNNKWYYYNWESDPYSTGVNANRWDFIEVEGSQHLFWNYDSATSPTAHHLLTDRTLTSLGSNLLQAGKLGGNVEYVPNDYITQTFPSNYKLEARTTAESYTFADIVGDTLYNSHNIEMNRAIRRDSASFVVSQLETNANAGKFATWENDAARGQVLMTYTIYGYEGYKLDSTMEDFIVSEGFDKEPLRDYIYIYDLLPPGASYYGSFQPVFGKLTTTQIGNKYRAITSEDVDAYVGTWDESKISIEETYVDDDWNGSGRTMVRFKIKYHSNIGETTDDKWYIGCGIRFKAHIPWDSYKLAAEKDNIFAYVAADDRHEGNLLGKFTGSASNSQTYDDAGILLPAPASSRADYEDYTPFAGYSDLDGTLFNEATNGKTDATQYNRMYGHANEMESITTARTIGITKSVKADADKDADYSDKTSVIENEGYTYKVHIDRTEQGEVHNFVIFDNLESIEKGTWKGTLKNVDLREFNKLYGSLDPAPAPVIYYSESHYAPTVLYRVKWDGEEASTSNCTLKKSEANNGAAFPEGNTIADYYARWDRGIVNALVDTQTDANGKSMKWYSATEWAELGKAPADAGSVAVDFSKASDGTAFNIPQNAVFDVYLKMTAPTYNTETPQTYTLNNSEFHFTNEAEDAVGHFTQSNITTVTLGQRRSLLVIKAVPQNPDSITEELLQNAEFTFQVKNKLWSVSVNAELTTDEDTNISTVDPDATMDKLSNYANIEYELYRVATDAEYTAASSDDREEANGKKYIRINKGITYATNDSGEFKLKYNQMAKFKEVAGASVSASEVNSFDFDNYTVVEKSVPYMFGQKNISTITSAGDVTKEILTVTNLYRPVIYLSKTVSGIPENMSSINRDFTFTLKVKKLFDDNDVRILDDESNPSYTYLTYDDLKDSGTYTILNKTVTKDGLDNRTDGKLYWYTVNGSAGLLETPDGWKAYPTADQMDKGNNSASVNTDGSFTVTFTADKDTTTVALPVYIQHIVNISGTDTDLGMLVKKTEILKDENGDPILDGEGDTQIVTVYYPRYDFEVVEELDSGEEWVIQSPVNYTASTDLENDQNVTAFSNVYRYKDVLLTKTVTHAPDDIATYAYAFRLTKKDGEDQVSYYQYGKPTYEESDTGHTNPIYQTVSWELFTQDITGELSEYPTKTEQITGTVDSNGFFIVPACGNSDTSTNDPIVIRVRGLACGDTFTITEILDLKEESGSYTYTPTLPDGSTGSTYTLPAVPSGYTLATTENFEATKESDTKTISVNSLITRMNVENDYIKRDIMIKKTVVSDTVPTNAFEMLLIPKKGNVDVSKLSYNVYDKDGNELAVQPIVTTDMLNGKTGYKFALHKDEYIVFKDIDNYGAEYDLYEKFDNTYRPLTMKYTLNETEDGTETGYSDAHNFTLPQQTDYGFTVINGKEGYIVVQKEFTGDSSFDSSDQLVKFTVTGEGTPLEEPTVANHYVTIVNSADQTVDPRYYGTLDNIAIMEDEFVIINMVGIYGQMVPYTVTETHYQQRVEQNGDLFEITPESAVISCSEDDRQAIIRNNVKKFATPIYKRITGEVGKKIEDPTGSISFTVARNGEPVQGVQCIPAYMLGTQKIYLSETLTSDANGIITVDPSFAETYTDGRIVPWKAEDGTSKYYLMLMFSDDIKINPSNLNDLSLTEYTYDENGWGYLIGCETYGDAATYVTTASVGGKNEFPEDSNTFVNTKETETIEVTKWVDVFDPEDDEEYSFVLAEWLGDEDYVASEGISYDVYELTDRTKHFSNAEATYKSTAEGTYTTDAEGVFKLKHGQKAVITVPKNLYWQITERNTGKYKLLTDENGVVTHGGETNWDAATHYREVWVYPNYQDAVGDKDLYIETDVTKADAGYTCYYYKTDGTKEYFNSKRGSQKATEGYAEMSIKDKFILDYAIPAADQDKIISKQEIEEITYGFELHSEQNSGSIPRGYDVVLVNGSCKGAVSHNKAGGQPMFAKYDASKDNFTTSGSFYYWGTSSNSWYHRFYNADTYNKQEMERAKHPLLIGNPKSDELKHITEIYSDYECSNLVWSYNSGTATNYFVGADNIPKIDGKRVVNLPDCVYFAETEGGEIKEHRIVGIGTGAYAGGGTNYDVIRIPKYVEKIGDNAFNGVTSLLSVIWSGDDTGYGVKQIGCYAFAGTKVDVVLPKTVETIEYGAFATDKKGTSNKEIIPSTLHNLVPNAKNDNKLENALNDATKYENLYIPLYIGDGKSLDTISTSFTTIGGKANVGTDYTIPLNAFHNSPMYWSTIVIGQNPNGVRVKSDFCEVINGAGGYTIVFPKGKLTLEAGCLSTDVGNRLRVFLTDNIRDLTIVGMLGNGNLTAANYVFPNLTQKEVEQASWYQYLSNQPGKRYYKDTLTNADISSIYTAARYKAGGTTYYPDQAVRDYLYNSIGATPPGSYPKPPTPTPITASELAYTDPRKLEIVE